MALDELAVTFERTAAIVAQARSRLAGQLPDGAIRRVSLYDPEARPIRKGHIDWPVESGSKAQIIGNNDGLVLGYGVETSNPPDAPQLAPAISRIARRAGRVPRSVIADRSGGEPATDRELEALGVRTLRSRAKPGSHPPAWTSSMPEDFAGSSSGGPAPKAGSATSSTSPVEGGAKSG